MTLAEILRTAIRTPGGLEVVVPEAWLQGRTAYGGLTAALALEAATSMGEFPPLRSAQVSFVGPLSGRVRVQAETLRRGKSAVFVGVDVLGETGLGLRAVFVFMSQRASGVDHSVAAPPDHVPADVAEPAFRRTAGPHFTGNFDYLHARPADAARVPADFLRWVRLAEPPPPGAVALMAIGDALPPAAMELMVEKGPVSSMTWLINVLVDEPVTRDGWWLLQSTATYARHGCSSQSMAIWNADGVPVATGMQSVALFA